LTNDAKPTAAPESAAREGTEQLVLPLDDFLARERPPRIPRHERVFCNRNLRMSNIAWVGFDMDYTLAIYNQAEMDRLSDRRDHHEAHRAGYPELIRDVEVPIDFAVRGLLIDKRFGHVLKMDRYKNVNKGFHGFRELTKEELRELYHTKKVRSRDAATTGSTRSTRSPRPSPTPRLVHDPRGSRLRGRLREALHDIRECDRRGAPRRHHPRRDPRGPPPLRARDPKLAPTLHKLRSAGKKLFLLTNSRWAYTERMMTYLLGGSMSEYPSWRNFFDVVIVAATQARVLPGAAAPARARERSHEAGHAFPLERGNLRGRQPPRARARLGVTGDQVLYVGDHIYGDILRSKKDSAWRTAMIIQELEVEVLAHASCKEDFETLDRLEELRERHEDDLRFYQARIKDLTRQLEKDPSDKLEAERLRVKRAVERIRGVLRQIEAEATAIERRSDARFHAYFGSLMKEGNEQSSFGKQVDEYACIYTSRVSNLSAYSPAQTFRSPRDEMAHEIGD
jgi:5'-nucleotidase